MELYDFIHVSQVMDALGKTVRGVLLLFFPGEREENTYRFLGALKAPTPSGSVPGLG